MKRDRVPADRDCRRIETALALGEPIEDRVLVTHLGGCAKCRAAAVDLGRVKHGLAVAPEIVPPVELDRIVRQSLRDRPLADGLLLRPGIAAGLAVAALFALIVTVSTLLAQAGAAEMGPVIGVVAVSVYLALCFAATVPLLLQPRSRGRDSGREVRP